VRRPTASKFWFMPHRCGPKRTAQSSPITPLKRLCAVVMPSVALRGHWAAAGNFRTNRRHARPPADRSRTYRRCTQTATSDIYSAESAISRALVQLGGPDRQAPPARDEPGSLCVDSYRAIAFATDG
jgi:hypothetical protein